MQKTKIRFSFYSLCSIAWFGCIVFASGASPNTQEKIGLLSFLKLIPCYDKIIHTGLYAVFCFLLHGAFWYAPKRPNAGLFALLVGVVTGIVMEFLQYAVFTGRSADWIDAIANSFGAICGVLCFALLLRRNAKKQQNKNYTTKNLRETGK